MYRCQAINKNKKNKGKQCSRRVKTGSCYCGVHIKVYNTLPNETIDNNTNEIDDKINDLLDNIPILNKIYKNENTLVETNIITTTDIETNKNKIIELFTNNIKGKDIILTTNHFGSEGHWLESQLDIKHNCNNAPDILGYEMKKESSKISFGDFSANEYLFSKNKPFIEEINNWETDKYKMKRDDFIKYFGTPNPKKHNRYSWSGKCVPNYGIWNSCGQKLIFNDKLDLLAIYSYEEDKRECKETLPDYLKNEIVIAIWKKEKLENHINNKFNKNGFFICKKINNVYQKICFGKPFNFIHFVENVKNKKIIFDSGMYRGNTRNYSQFRSNGHSFWDNLIIEEY